ncbi:macrophage mannose receptor 1-like [Silurus meridionalis]|uniref:macrophage mannose receptor 1-like n=1 Tax=Silurus meridionalis TaxID=175797 RepID=UPI001EEA9B60|nr:macrophage mannose receptor 1-like [Silurus meridionalis]
MIDRGKESFRRNNIRIKLQYTMEQKHLFLHLTLYLTSFVSVDVSLPGGIPHKYDLIMTKMSWADAQIYCREKYTDIATVVSNADSRRLNKEAASKGLATPAWVGLYDDIKSWRWSLNNLLLLDVGYTSWSSGQPNNALSLESCVAVGANGNWYDTACYFVRAIVCYNANFSDDKKFVAINTQVTWAAAQAYCRLHYTDLASSLNSSDQSLLAVLQKAQGDSWIGLSRETWKWSDRTNVTNLFWASGKPNNAARVWGSCASVSNGLFSDESCYNLNYFFCHTIPPVRTYIKLQVKGDDSVFDSVLQSFILEQIRQKLDQNGMLENTTVTWRVQADGNVFTRKKHTP